MAIDAEVGEIIEHLLDLLHIGFLVNGRVGCHLIAEILRHLYCENALLEDTFAFHDQIVNALQSIEVDVPIHPFTRRDRGLGRVFRTFSDFSRIFLAKQTDFH